MCGIIGVFGEQAADRCLRGMEMLRHRGRDGFGIFVNSLYQSSELGKLKIKDKDTKVALGHSLHAIVSHVPQPFSRKGTLVANCEIYNWKTLKEKYDVQCKNDAELLFLLLEKGLALKTILHELDGVYAFAYLKDSILLLARDILGVKPLFYSRGFGFASEPKALRTLGMDPVELNPRRIAQYELSSKKLWFQARTFFSASPCVKESPQMIKARLKQLLYQAVQKRIPEQKFGVLFSGGVDSSYIALLLKQMDIPFTCYTTTVLHPDMKEPADLDYAKRAAKALELNLRITEIDLAGVEQYLKKVIPLIEDSNVVKAGVGATLFVACEMAKKDGVKVLFSGLGSEEIFAGYQRHGKAGDINSECLSGLRKLYERDTFRDDVVSMANTIEIRLPFLDKDLVAYALKIPGRYKLDTYDKQIFRELAEALGLPSWIAKRPKKAAQYGSNMDKAISKLARNKGYKYKSAYLKEFIKRPNLRLGVLYSGGKDSNFALYTMLRQNYQIACLMTMKSQNPDSYMYHTPNIDLVTLQSQALEFPLLIQETAGKKEKELRDLAKALQKAQKTYRIQGVVTGALYSSYQRDRIEKVCDDLGLKVFSPLWHIDQVGYMKNLLHEGFKVILSSIAAQGLTKSWLGRMLTLADVNHLASLQKKIGLNPSFEGGEAETLVIDAPMFHKKIRVDEAQILMENQCTGRYIIKKAGLKDK